MDDVWELADHVSPFVNSLRMTFCVLRKNRKEYAGCPQPSSKWAFAWVGGGHTNWLPHPSCPVFMYLSYELIRSVYGFSGFPYHGTLRSTLRMVSIGWWDFDVDMNHKELGPCQVVDISILRSNCFISKPCGIMSNESNNMTPSGLSKEKPLPKCSKIWFFHTRGLFFQYKISS
jgi:hypothetical protein